MRHSALGAFCGRVCAFSHHKASAYYDFAFVVPCHVWACAELAFWVVHIVGLQGDFTQIEADCLKDIRGDFCKVI